MLRRSYLLLTALVVCCHPAAGRADVPEGYRPLFTGQSLAGWQPYNCTAADWSAQGGVLRTEVDWGSWPGRRTPTRTAW
jgi:hypothetical protein